MASRTIQPPPPGHRAWGWALAAVTLLALTLVVATGTDLRRITNATGVAAFGLLLWRIGSWWDRLTGWQRTASLLLAFAPLVAAFASVGLQARTTDLPPNPWLWLVLAHRVACLGLVVAWPRLMTPRRTT